MRDAAADCCYYSAAMNGPASGQARGQDFDYSYTARVRNARAAADEMLILGSLAPQHDKHDSASMSLLRSLKVAGLYIQAGRDRWPVPYQLALL